MSEIETMLADSFRTILVPMGGVAMTSDVSDSFVGLIEDLPTIDEPGEVAKAKLPIYANITADSDKVASPRTVKTFTEDVSGRTHKVLKFLPKAGNSFSYVWLVETQRT